VAIDHLRVPFSVVTLFEEERPFVVGRSGGDGAVVDGTEGLSRHVIDSDDVVVFEDLEKTERYRPLAPAVAGRPLRFFAAAPMVLPNDTRIGTLCILDHTPRELNIGQRIVLKQLAAVATNELMTLAGCRSAA
jgi:GAF domain-containing protein